MAVLNLNAAHIRPLGNKEYLDLGSFQCARINVGCEPGDDEPRWRLNGENSAPVMLRSVESTLKPTAVDEWLKNGGRGRTFTHMVSGQRPPLSQVFREDGERLGLADIYDGLLSHHELSRH